MIEYDHPGYAHSDSKSEDLYITIVVYAISVSFYIKTKPKNEKNNGI